ncbi:MAG TPA: SDR family NAD(P)-dependent oxidoreductase [Roseiflexaceae bacterium]|nr:SDR family NAD(P)-dependent oxidoreductase [Roseiflexaceae bacterium]
MKVNGHTILITGASYGIGAALARRIALAGGQVVLLARTRDALEHVADEVRTGGGQACIYPVDLADAAAVERVAQAILAEVGPPDILINNAGAGRWLFLEETDPAEAQAMMAVPYFAAFHVTRAFLPAMLRHGSGQIVNVNSPASLVAWPGATAYTAARWALRGFSEALRADLHGTGLRVTEVIPGKVSSTYFTHNPGTEARAPWIAKLLGTITPEQAAAEMLRGIERGQRQIVLPFRYRLLYIIHRVWPGLVRWLAAATGARRPNVKRKT